MCTQSPPLRFPHDLSPWFLPFPLGIQEVWLCVWGGGRIWIPNLNYCVLIPTMPPKSRGVWTLETSSSLWSRLGHQGREVRMMCFAPGGSNPAFGPAWPPVGVAGICYLSEDCVLMGKRRLWSETVGFKFQLGLWAVWLQQLIYPLWSSTSTPVKWEPNNSSSFIAFIVRLNTTWNNVDSEQTYGHQGGKGGGDELGDWDWHIYTTIYKIDN